MINADGFKHISIVKSVYNSIAILGAIELLQNTRGVAFSMQITHATLPRGKLACSLLNSSWFWTAPLQAQQ
jgi:hypothetical protein